MSDPLVSQHRPRLAALLVVGALLTLPFAVAAEPLKVCATVPELGSLVGLVGGPDVEVTVFAKPSEDPHFVDARPSFVRDLNEADMLVLVGFDLEIGWLPALVQNARNSKVLRGGNGYVDASQVVAPLDVPQGTVDRSMGDVHAKGNPHYLLDPIEGLNVAALLRDRLAALAPGKRDSFESRFRAFRGELARRLAGEAVADRYDVAKLARLQENRKLLPFLSSVAHESELAGWWGALLSKGPVPVVQDHRIWPYFARRFGLRIVADLEPKPGIAPTTKHIGEVAEIIRADKVPVVMTAAYYDPKYGDFLARQTGVTVVRMANQVGARPGTDSYLDMIGYNVDQIAAALAGRADSGTAP